MRHFLTMACLLTLSSYSLATTKAHFTQHTDSVDVAEEFFGDDSVKLRFSEVNEFQPKIVLTIGGVETLGDKTDFTVTFSLDNAVFSESVSTNNITWIDESDTSRDSELEFRRSGGAKGDSSVSFQMTLRQSVSIHDPNERMLVFTLPNLMTEGLREDKKSITVSTTVTQTVAGGGRTNIIDGIMVPSSDVLDKCAALPTTTADLQLIKHESASCPLVKARKVIQGIEVVAGEGRISISDRKVLVDEEGVALKEQNMKVATFTIQTDFSSGIRDLEGNSIGSFNSDFNGRLIIDLESENFNSGDYISVGESASDDEASAVTTSELSKDIALTEDPIIVWYTPSGDSSLRHQSSISVVATTRLNDSNTLETKSEMAMAVIKLHGIRNEVIKAYAIAPPSSSDISNIRVTCETSAQEGCRVFFDCRSHDGTSFFDEAGEHIGPNVTARWNQHQLADVLGISQEWQGGRLACNIVSTEKINAQVLTRSSGVLVNNSSLTPVETR